MYRIQMRGRIVAGGGVFRRQAAADRPPSASRVTRPPALGRRYAPSSRLQPDRCSIEPVAQQPSGSKTGEASAHDPAAGWQRSAIDRKKLGGGGRRALTLVFRDKCGRE